MISVPAMEERENAPQSHGSSAFWASPIRFRAVDARHDPVGAGVSCWLVDNEIVSSRPFQLRPADRSGSHNIPRGLAEDAIKEIAPHLILISPGPGRPADFGVPALVLMAVRLGIPVFGVCWDCKACGSLRGQLGVLDYPMHGKRSMVRHAAWGFSKACPRSSRWALSFLYARRDTSQPAWKRRRIERGRDNMGVRHRELPSRRCSSTESILS